MACLARTVRRFRGLLSRTKARDVHDELQLHLDLLADEYRAQGLSDKEARAHAQRDFGNTARLGEMVQEITTFPWLEGLLQDIAFGARRLRREPGLTTLAVVSLALGIGANTAIFSIVNGLMLRTLPVPHPERLAALSLGDHDVTRVDGSRWSYAFWRAFEEHREQFDGVMAWSPVRLNVSNRDGADTAEGTLVDGGYFATLGVPVIIGRTIVAADDQPGAATGPVAVISHGYWQRRFGGAADIVGSTLTVRGTPVTVIGVTRPSFTGLEVGQAFDVALPLAIEPRLRGAQSNVNPPFDRMNMWLRIGVRLREGQSLESGDAVVRSLQPQLREASFPHQFPQLRETFLRDPLGLVTASTGLSRLRQLYRRPLTLLLAVVALVLLLACVNVANLLLAQATARGRELGIRLALGGSRWRVARQLLIESALLTTMSLVAGVLVAMWAARALIAQFSTPAMSVALNVGPDWRVLAMTSLVGVMTTLICGTAAALRVTLVTPADALTDGARGVAGSHRAWVSNMLLTSQVALSLTLVVTACLFISTFARLTLVPLGFDRDKVLLVNVNSAQAEIAPADRGPLYQRLADVVRAVPGAEQATASSSTPVSATNVPVVIRPASTSGESTAEPGEAKSLFVTPGWFTTYGVPVHAGRDVSVQDTQGSLPVMVVNQAFVDRFFPGRIALGESAGIAAGTRGEVTLSSRTIVGVVGNSIYRSLRESSLPAVYVPLGQYDHPVPMNSFIAIGVRSATAPPSALSKDVTSALTAIKPGLSVTTRTLASQVDESVNQEQLLAALSSLFGVIALFLAACGLFGVTSHSVARRQAEIAVRIAVGAGRADIVRAVLSRVCVPVGLGIVGGIVLSTWLSRFVATLLFGVTPGDLTTLISATATLIIVALCAAWIPTRRALLIDPVQVLRAS